MSVLNLLVWDCVRFGFLAIILGIVVGVAIPESSVATTLIVGGLVLMLSGVVGVFVVRWWDYRQGNEVL